MCNLLAWLLAWGEQTGQDSMSSHHLKTLTHIKQPWREGTSLPYTLIHFKPLRMFLLHLHSRLTLHVQRLYCPHKPLSRLSLCQCFPQLHPIHSVIRFVQVNEYYKFLSIAFPITCLKLNSWSLYVLIPLTPLLFHDFTLCTTSQPSIQNLSKLYTSQPPLLDSLLYNCYMSTCDPSCGQE